MNNWICAECAECAKEFQRYKSQVRDPNRVFCSKDCKGKWQAKHLCGSQNPNYKSGSYSEPSLCRCGEQKDLRSSQCSKCAKRGFRVNGKNDYLDQTELTKAVASSSSYEEVATKLGVKRCTVTKYIEQAQLDISHFRAGRGRPTPTDQLFVPGEVQRNTLLKGRILQEELIPHVCDECGLLPCWNGKPLVLQLHHVNGDPKDNRLENLRFLCPNCHSQTPTFCGKNARNNNDLPDL